MTAPQIRWLIVFAGLLTLLSVVSRGEYTLPAIALTAAISVFSGLLALWIQKKQGYWS